MDNIIDIGLYVSYGLLIIAAVAAIILPLINSLSQPKALLKAGVGVVTLVVIFLIGYVISDSGVTTMYTTLGVGPETSKFVGGALIAMYILMVIAIIGIIVTEFNKAIK
ncbi:MAG: hypothetical protein ACNS60_15200 [Candidatus Cyclobacteriaceae bacterium M2_1C_046]